MEKEYREIIKRLKENANPKNVAGMARFGIGSKNTLGISIPFLRQLAKESIKAFSDTDKEKKEHKLAFLLWDSKLHEARILAAFIDVPELVTEKQMDTWVNDFDSWDVCDQVCMNLFDKTKFLDEKIKSWAMEEKEYVRRAAFSLIATTAVHNKKLEDRDFQEYFSLIKRYSKDERNFVKKAVNWALRQIGKRNENLRKEAIKVSYEILSYDNKTARWIARDAIKELEKKTFKNL